MGIFDSETTSKIKMNDRQKKLVDAAMPRALEWLNSTFKLGPSIFAGKNPLMEQGAKSLQGAAGTVGRLSSNGIGNIFDFSNRGGDIGLGGAAGLAGVIPGASSGMGALLKDYRSTAGSRDFLTSGALLNPNTNPALKGMTKAAVRPITENLTEKILPGIRSNFAGGNMFGSSRQGLVERGANRDYMRTVGDVTANLQNNAFNQGLGAMLSATNKATDAAVSGIGSGFQAGASGAGIGSDMALQALGLSPELGRLAFMPGTMLDSLGERDRQMTMAKRTEASERFNTKQMMPWLKAQDVMQLAFGIPGGSSSASSGGSTAGNLAGLGMTAAGMWPMISQVLPMLPFVSDRRLKTNIELVGKVGEYNWYSFEYKDRPGEVTMGVMADEVRKIKPEAVVEINGYDCVFYNAL